MKVGIIRRAYFNAAHKLEVKAWSQQKNAEVFGRCANPNFHGHNYTVDVTVIGEVDPTTGMVINLKELKNIIRVEVEDRFDHKNLNEDVEEFKSLIPTVENICIVIHQILSEKLQDFEIRVKLYETRNNFVEYPVVG